MTGKTILIAAVACVGVVGAIQGFFSIGCTTDGSGGSGSAPDGEGDGGNTNTQEEPPLSLQERLARCEETKPNACPGGNDDALRGGERRAAGRGGGSRRSRGARSRGGARRRGRSP